MANGRERYFDWRTRALLAPALVGVLIAVWGAAVGPISSLTWVAAVVVAVLGILWASIAKPTRRRAIGVAFLLALLTLCLNGSIALLFVELIDARWALDDADWLQTLLIMTANVGAIFAGFRSAATRSETAATLNALTELQVAATSVPIVEASVRAYQSVDIVEVSAELETMLRLAINLRLLPPEFSRGRVWARDDRNGEWYMCGASGLDMRADFRLPTIDKPEPGAGIIANLAVSPGPFELEGAWIDNDVFLCGALVGSHPWFRARTPESVPPAGLVAVIIRDDGRAIGALTLTSAHPISINVRDRNEMAFVLRAWSWAFAVGLKQLRRFLTERSTVSKLETEVES